MTDSASEIIIPPTMTKRIKLSESEIEDRLGDLPETVILHILSFLNAKQAVETCVLSKRWKDLWKRLPKLILCSDDYGTYKIFTEFVSKVLALRDSSMALQALDFKPQNGRSHMVKRIINYAISHNVQQLGLYVNGHITEIPSKVFFCRTLTHLKLSIYPGINRETMFPKSLNLPAITNLQLEHFTFCVGDDDRAEPFSNFNRLSGCNASSLKHVDIDADLFSYPDDPPLFLFSWLLEFANIKSLTVSAATLQVLSLVPDLLNIKLPSLVNLKSLRVIIKPLGYGFRKRLCDVKLRKVKSKKKAARLRKAFEKGLEPSPLVPEGIVDFLLQNSPSAEVDFIDKEMLARRARSL
ncbi:FDB-associated F-box protein [Trifolium pratense]|uniref:FDB-associated F-box protein n=1 Tax=Trifolium pratense TaxID=57577 RepID=A0A2K3NWC3_TRIPR|nr:FDB-associated F-box protein [Trifolium pratense]